MATPLLDLYGPMACDAYYLFTVGHADLVGIGGVGMALFRMICTTGNIPIGSLQKLTVRLMLGQYSICFIFWATHWWSVNIYGSSNLFQFCRGYTAKVTLYLQGTEFSLTFDCGFQIAHLLLERQGISKETIQHGKRIFSSSIVVAQVCPLLELGCYIYIYWSLREKDKSLVEIIQEDVLKKRAKKNAITLTGQALGFVVEMTYMVLVQLLFHLGTLGGFFEPGALPCASLVVMAAITSSQILASPELRRFIQGLE